MRFYFSWILVLSGLLLFSCKKEDEVACVTCTSEITLPFDLCQESDGNASVNGENTGTAYEIYLQDLEQDGVICDR